MITQSVSVQKIDNVIKLPEICAFNGSRDDLAQRNETIVFIPYWSLALIPLGILPFVLAFAALRREQKISYYLSSAGRKRVLLFRASMLGCILLMFASIYLALNYSTGFLYLTLGSVGAAAFLYRSSYFPFKYAPDKNKEVIVYGLPREFDIAVS